VRKEMPVVLNLKNNPFCFCRSLRPLRLCERRVLKFSSKYSVYFEWNLIL